MRHMIQAAILSIFAATSGQADGKPEVIDTVVWVRGCAALTQTYAYAYAMDAKCMANAIDYCEMRQRDEISACYDRLVEYWNDESVRILKTLPDGQNLTGFAKGRFERTKARLTSPDYLPEIDFLKTLPDGAQKTQYSILFRSAMKWVDLRGLVRLANKYERSEP